MKASKGAHEAAAEIKTELNTRVWNHNYSLFKDPADEEFLASIIDDKMHTTKARAALKIAEEELGRLYKMLDEIFPFLIEYWSERGIRNRFRELQIACVVSRKENTGRIREAIALLEE